MREKIVFLIFVVGMSVSMGVRAVAQFSSPEYSYTPDKPLTVFFRDTTGHAPLAGVLEVIRSSKVVRPFHMVRANRGFLMYEGLYYGNKDFLLNRISSEIRGKLKMKERTVGQDGLEIEFSKLE